MTKEQKEVVTTETTSWTWFQKRIPVVETPRHPGVSGTFVMWFLSYDEEAPLYTLAFDP